MNIVRLRNIIHIIFCLLLVTAFTGCASNKAVVKKDFSFSNIKKIAILKLSGNGGEAVSNELIRQFISAGISVVDRTDVEYINDIKSLGVDAVVSGNVLEFNPSNKLLIFKDKGNVIISDKVYPISGTTVSPSGSALGIEDASVFSVSASVSISAKITDVSLGEVVWSDSESYEALDINTAIGITVGSLKKSLKTIWKELQ
ncbi:MAG: hypothetical protein PHE88_04265 [Elusimicrobia bacterium]|nr:hypothetical protein [Elusimicrobiota bacterium]